MYTIMYRNHQRGRPPRGRVHTPSARTANASRWRVLVQQGQCQGGQLARQQGQGQELLLLLLVLILAADIHPERLPV